MRENRRLPLVRRIITQRGIRASLLGAFIVLTFVPLAIMGLVLRWQAAAHMTEQVVAHLSAVSTLEVQEVEEFFAEHAEGLGNVLLTSEAQDNALYLLRHSPSAKGYRLAEGATYDLFRSVLRQDEDMAELLLIDREGIVVLSTEAQHRGALEADQMYLLEGLRGHYASPLLLDSESGQTVIYLAEPVHDFSVGVNRGILVARLSSQAIDDILSERTGLGQTGEVYLIIPPGQLITPLRHVTSSPPDLNTHGIRQALAGHEGFGLYTNYAGAEVIGYYRWLPEVGAGLIAEQARDEALTAVDQLTGFALVVASIVTIVTVSAILMLTQRIAQPIVQLAAAAEAITAGNWETPIPSGARDEVGTLAGAFQTMTGRLRELIETLEQRVAERTRALAYRSLQLETAAQISEAASSILNPGELERQVVELIRQRFDYYYVGLFLVDESGEWTSESGRWAVLRAGTGEPGRQMLEQGHKLEVGGTSMIGWCMANKQARIALDVTSARGSAEPSVPLRAGLTVEASVELREEAVRFDNPLLPETRSEMALPLISRGQAIGALTIQSSQEAAFSEEDIAVLQTMANQVANAIANARLYDQAQREITERKRAEEALRVLLLLDELTGLYNRRGFFNLAEQQLKIADRTKRRILLLFADFDHLKRINDALGHHEGDRALIEIADVLKETFRESDIMARIGGDELVVLAIETDGASADDLTTRLQENLEVRNAEGDRRYKLSLSVGIARYDPAHPCSIDELLARADRLMYEQKHDNQKS